MVAVQSSPQKGNSALQQRTRGAAAVLAFMLFFIGPAGLLANPFVSSPQDRAPLVRSAQGTGPLVNTQLSLREQIAAALNAFHEQPHLFTVLAIIGAAFIYGILHAAGPGHRKTVVFSLFLGKPAKPWEPLIAGFVSSMVHAGMGILIVLGLSILRGTIISLGDAEQLREYLDLGTFLLLGFIAILLIGYRGWSLFKELFGKNKPQETALPEGSSLPGTGTPSKQALTREVYILLFITSLVPCPGAMMLLLFSLYGDLVWLGVVGVIAMSIGMGLVISLAGYLAYFGNTGLFMGLKKKGVLLDVVSHGLELVSYFLLLGFSLYMASPFLFPA
jgi:ABC-type nickel/cobalt efflux system permease component RcnA